MSTNEIDVNAVNARARKEQTPSNEITSVELIEEIKIKITDTLIGHDYISDWVNTGIDGIVECLQKEKEKANEARDKEWRDAIQRLINVSNDASSDDWFNGLRACRSIKLPTK